MTEKKLAGKWVIARFQHETNTFSPIPTPLEAFNPRWGEDAYHDQKNARTAMGAFIQNAQEENVELMPIQAARYALKRTIKFVTVS